MTISDRIKSIRKEEHLNQTEFGKKLGVNRDTISNIELSRNKNGIPDNIIKLIALTFNVNEEWILTGKGEPCVKPEQSNFINTVIKAEKNDDKLLQSIVTAYDNLPNEAKDYIYKFIKDIYENMENNNELAASKEKEELPPELAELPPDEKIKTSEMLANSAEKEMELSASQEQSGDYKNA